MPMHMTSGSQTGSRASISISIPTIASNQGSRKVKTEIKHLEDEVATLTAAFEAAIEEAMKDGQKSLAGCKDTPKSDQLSGKEFTPTQINSGSRVVGWVDDF